MSRALDSLRREDGMTLVEVLLASIIMLVVLGATLATLNQFERTVKTNELQNDAQEEARRGLDLMARDLRNLASPTPLLPEAVDRAEAQDVIFQSEGKDKPDASLNAQNTTRVRYCLDLATSSLYRQIQTWETAANPPMPVSATCPGDGWTTTQLISGHVVNGERPVFTYNSGVRTEITEVSSLVYVDSNPGIRPSEVDLQTTVFLRNQNRIPTAAFSWASVPSASDIGNIFLNASASTDPEEKAMTYEWWDATLGVKVGEGIVYTYPAPAAGERDIYLVVRDATLEAISPTQTVCATGPGETC
jgi:type II secretory pathway pseudopilin PulG